MALSKQIEVAASQTGATLIDPGASFGLIIDRIVVSPATDIECEVWHGASQTVNNTLVHIQKGGIDKSFISGRAQNGKRLPLGEVLKLTNGADTVKVTVDYHLDDNAVG